MVQMEARSADRRLRADVRAARFGQAVQLSTATIPSAAGPRTASCSPSARPISASPTRSCNGSIAIVRNHTVNRFGPVREVEKSLVLEVAFDSIHKSSNRHKSGLAMRFPRISRIRTDKPADEADRIETAGWRLARHTKSPPRSIPDELLSLGRVLLDQAAGSLRHICRGGRLRCRIRTGRPR